MLVETMRLPTPVLADGLLPIHVLAVGVALLRDEGQRLHLISKSSIAGTNEKDHFKLNKHLVADLCTTDASMCC